MDSTVFYISVLKGKKKELSSEFNLFHKPVLSRLKILSPLLSK